MIEINLSRISVKRLIKFSRRLKPVDQFPHKLNVSRLDRAEVLLFRVCAKTIATLAAAMQFYIFGTAIQGTS